ncbi:DUF3392 family protein [Salinimonas lutimaris]|uniref:DUF3392 family protein n=1 Tax=Salinimonas lutimaris TaxID=914153 RepID=UPI0010BF6E2A|nr:DUF3392 family protein [Salinimonas lutimaris]
MAEWLTQVTRWLAPYFTEMSLMFMATLLVVFGDIINKQVKAMLSPCHFIIRVLLFVLMCAFGYGALTLYGAPLVLHVIKFFPYYLQGALFITAFIAIGVFAERRRYM